MTLNARRKVAESFGIMSHHASEAAYIASVPKKTRNREIERTPPIYPGSLAALASRPRRRKYVEKAVDPITLVRDEIRCLQRDCETAGEPAALARLLVGAPIADIVHIRDMMTSVQEWLDAFEQALPKVKT